MTSNKVTAVVLAGGGSTRMGQDKALLKLGNKTMLERVVEPLQSIFENIIIVTNTPNEYKMLNNVKFINDCINIEEKNSLIGLYSGLKESETSHIFAIGCDMPFVNTELIKYMINLLKNEDVVVPFVKGYYEPLYAIYGKGCTLEFERLIKQKWYKVTDVFKNVNVKKVIEEDINKIDSSMKCFENINTYEQYVQLKDIFE